MSDPTPEEILNLNPNPLPQEAKKYSIGWVIFLLIFLTPVGLYYVWRKTDWPLWVKTVVTTLTVIIFIGLLIESELIATQITGNLQ